MKNNFLLEIVIAWKAHANHAKERKKAVRKWNKRTPYGVHPVWCAMSLLHETTLPRGLRESGAVALLYHDVPEDTNAILPAHLTNRVRRLVRGKTFTSSDEEMQKVWKRSKEVRLLTLFDKVSNLLDGVWMSPEKREVYLTYTRRLAADVERNFGTLDIVRFARSLV